MIKSLFIGTALISVLFLSGCATSGARYIDPQGTETIVSINQINIQDWQNAADQLVQSLLSSGAVEQAPRQPAVLAISRIINNTSQHVDTDSLIKKIRVALSRTGKVATTTTMGLGGRAEDPLAKEASEYAAFMNDTPVAAATPMPDFTLTAKLLEDGAKAGRTRQVTYSFQMSLTSVATGLAVWEDEVQITKSGRKPSVGW